MKTTTATQAYQALNAINELFSYFTVEAQLQEPTLSLVRGQLHNLHAYIYNLSECAVKNQIDK